MATTRDPGRHSARQRAAESVVDDAARPPSADCATFSEAIDRRTGSIRTNGHLDSRAADMLGGLDAVVTAYQSVAQLRQRWLSDFHVTDGPYLVSCAASRGERGGGTGVPPPGCGAARSRPNPPTRSKTCSETCSKTSSKTCSEPPAEISPAIPVHTGIVIRQRTCSWL